METVFRLRAEAVASGGRGSSNPFRLRNWLDAEVASLTAMPFKGIEYYCVPGSEVPYSVDEIYGLRNVTGTSDYKTYKRVYNETYKLYNLSFDHEVRPEHVITEDSNSGYQFFEKVYPGICEPAGGCIWCDI